MSVVSATAANSTGSAPGSQPERVVIFDTTLRDGEQSPGASMNHEEKLRIARVLEEMGVDIIEAGFPIASNGDFEAVREVGRIIKRSTVAGLARAQRRDIERCAEALEFAERKRIHTFISTSPLHMKFKLQMQPDQVLLAVSESVAIARNLCDDVEWSAEDGSRTEHDFLCRCVEAAIKAGATTINIPDTVGYGVPEEYGALFAMVRNRVPNIDRAVLSVHCHNDLGLAVANTLAGVGQGARQIECTINGLGERAGNAALEEIVMALRTRHDLLPYTTGINTEIITRASRLVSKITGFVVQPNKAIVGANAFAHESGIHQDGMLKHPGTYEIMTPASVGLVRDSADRGGLVMGKHSGRNAFRTRLRDLGYALDETVVSESFRRFKELADQKECIYDEDLIALVEDQIGHAEGHINFVSLRVFADSWRRPLAELTLKIGDEEVSGTESGNGAIDAIFNATKKLCKSEARLSLYQVKAVTGGSDSQAEVMVGLVDGNLNVVGTGFDCDTLFASCRAYVHALNKLIIKRQGTAPPSLSA